MLILFGQVQVSLASGDLRSHEALGLLVVSRVVDRHRYGTDRESERKRERGRERESEDAVWRFGDSEFWNARDWCERGEMFLEG